MTNPMQQNRAALFQMEVQFDNVEEDEDDMPISAGGGNDFQLPGEDAETVGVAQYFLIWGDTGD